MKTKTISKILFLTSTYLAAFCFGPIEKVEAATNYYVSTSGSDSNPGTQASPFKTISKAALVVTAGGTVHVAPGTYNETITSNPSGTSSAYITYLSDTKWGAKIVSSATGTSAAWHNNGDYVAIIGFDITGGGALGINHSGSGDVANNNHVHNIPAVGCTGFGGAGISFDNYNGKSGFTADGNVVNDIGPLNTNCFRVQGIYPSIPNGTISNNIIYHVVGYAINTGHNSYSCKIVNNTMFANGGTVEGGGIVITGNDFSIQSHGFIVSNNIIYDNVIGIHEEGSQGTNTYSNNLVFQNSTNFGNLNGHSNTSNVSADPQFLNYQKNGTGDYHLKSTSPAIDKGTGSNAPSKDYDGNARPQGAGYDIGAYEYTSSSCSAPSIPNGPSNLTAVAASSGTRIDLTWTDNSGLESAYIVERSTDGTTFTQIASLAPNTTSYSNTGLSPNTKYYYRVMATNCVGNSAYSAIVNATTTITTHIDEETTAGKVIVYPNPSSSEINLKIPVEVILKNAAIIIYDVSGKEVRSISINGSETPINRDKLQSGIYFYTIINNNESIGKGKLIIQ